MKWEFDRVVEAHQRCNKGMCRAKAVYRVASPDWWRRKDGRPRGDYTGTVLFFCAEHMGAGFKERAA